MKDKIYEIRIRKTETLTKKQQENIENQLKRLGDSGYVGYSKIYYAIDKNKSSRNNLVLKIVDIEPIEGTIIDESRRIHDKLGDVF